MRNGKTMTLLVNGLEAESTRFDGTPGSVRVAASGYGGLAQSLDFWLSDDTGEEHYRDAVARFKAKWMRRTPRNRVEFYEGKIQAYADKCKVELGLKEFEEE